MALEIQEQIEQFQEFFQTNYENKIRDILTEGKKHQIRRMCMALGWQVKILKRVRVVNILLEKLKPNQYRKIVGKELQAFLKELELT